MEEKREGAAMITSVFRSVFLLLCVFSLTSCADLTVKSLSHSPENPTTVDTITFTAVVQNVGWRAAEPSKLSFRVGGETYPPVYPVPALNVGATHTVQRQLQLNVAQNYRNTVTVDIDNSVNESNERNNIATDDYTVTQGESLVVDHSSLVSDGYLILSGAEWAQQTFEVSQTAKLEGIEVALRRCQTPDAATITLEVGQDTTSFGSVTKPATAIAALPETATECSQYPNPLDLNTTGPGYYDLSGLNRTLVAGQKYYFKVTTTDSPSMGFRIGFTTTQYPDGELVLLSGPFSQDLVFKIVLRLSP